MEDLLAHGLNLAHSRSREARRVLPRGAAQTWRALQPISCVHAPGPDGQQTRHLCWVLVMTRRKRRDAGESSAWAGRSPAATSRTSSISPPRSTTTRRSWSAARLAESWNTSAAAVREPDRWPVRPHGSVRFGERQPTDPIKRGLLRGRLGVCRVSLRLWTGRDGGAIPLGPGGVLVHLLSGNMKPVSRWLLTSSSCVSGVFGYSIMGGLL